jgi:hypothetical protein
MNVPKVIIYPKLPIKLEHSEDYSNCILQLFDEKLVDGIDDIVFKKTKINDESKTEAIKEVVFQFDDYESMYLK